MLTVSSEEFQRNVDRYMDQAETQTVFITHEGQVRLVMISIEEYRRIQRQHDGTEE